MTEYFETEQDQLDKNYTTLTHSWFDPWKQEEIICKYRFRKPTQAEVNRYTKEAGKNSVFTANQNLLVAMVHEEDKSRLLLDIQEYPALPTALGNWALKVSGFGDLGN